MMRYYSTQRPVAPGAYPRQGGTEDITNFDGPTYCTEIGREAWGYIEYAEPLTKEQAEAYELTPGNSPELGFALLKFALFHEAQSVSNMLTMDNTGASRKKLLGAWEALTRVMDETGLMDEFNEWRG